MGFSKVLNEKDKKDLIEMLQKAETVIFTNAHKGNFEIKIPKKKSKGQKTLTKQYATYILGSVLVSEGTFMEANPNYRRDVLGALDGYRQITLLIRD